MAQSTPAPASGASQSQSSSSSQVPQATATPAANAESSEPAPQSSAHDTASHSTASAAPAHTATSPAQHQTAKPQPSETHTASHTSHPAAEPVPARHASTVPAPHSPQVKSQTARKPAAAPKSATAQKPRKAAETAPQKPDALPDYGGRDSAVGQTLGSGSGGGAINPLAQAGRAFEALIVVLALVVGGLFLLKRIGLIKSDGSVSLSFAKSPTGQPKRPVEAVGESLELLTLIGTQTLPHSGGACLHLVALGSRTLLLGATSQSVSLLTELEAGDLEEAAVEAAEPETPAEAAAFADYLTRVGLSSGPTNAIRAAEATLATATDRLQSLLAGSREEKTL